METTTLVDDVDNTASTSYAAWPERIYIFATEGTIAYRGGKGPFHFRPEEIGVFLQKRYAAKVDE